MKSCIFRRNSISEFFSIKSGFPQGAVFWTKFFNLVIDKLIVNLERICLGCFVGNCFAGAFTYADDIIL